MIKFLKIFFIFMFCVGLFLSGFIFCESLSQKDIFGYIVSIGHFILYIGFLLWEKLEVEDV